MCVCFFFVCFNCDNGREIFLWENFLQELFYEKIFDGNDFMKKDFVEINL